MDELARSRWDQRRTLIVFCIVLPLALAYFGIRGPVRAVGFWEFNDFISPYMQTKAWLRGENPYDPRVVAQLWPSEAESPLFLQPESENGTLPARRGIPSPYPPTGFPLLAPVALMTWPSASLVWVAISMLSFTTILACVLAAAQVPLRSTEAGAIVLCALMLAPFHTAIAVGNIVLLVFALGMLAWRCAERGCHVWAGLLLAGAAALKPTVALPFLVFFVAQKRWRELIVTLAAGAALLLVADVRMMSAGVHWASSYLLNSRRMFAPGGIDDFTSANPMRFDLLNLQVVLFQAIGRSVVVSGGCVADRCGVLVVVDNSQGGRNGDGVVRSGDRRDHQPFAFLSSFLRRLPADSSARVGGHAGLGASANHSPRPPDRGSSVRGSGCGTAARDGGQEFNATWIGPEMVVAIFRCASPGLDHFFDSTAVDGGSDEDGAR